MTINRMNTKEIFLPALILKVAISSYTTGLDFSLNKTLSFYVCVCVRRDEKMLENQYKKIGGA